MRLNKVRIKKEEKEEIEEEKEIKYFKAEIGVPERQLYVPKR